MIHTVNIRDQRTAVALFDRAAEAMAKSPWRRGSVERLPSRGMLVVTGDLHDNMGHLAKILTLARLRESPDHHVLLHELIHGDKLVNGLDFSHQMLAKTAELVLKYPGQVHPLLANHELAQMVGKEVDKLASHRVKLFDQALEFVFGPGWGAVRDAIHNFIRAMPLALVTDSGLLCAHSLPSRKVMRRFDLNILDRDLRPCDYVGPGGSAYEMVRGRDYSEKSVTQLAMRWQVKLFCLGHQHVAEGAEPHGGNVVVLNSDHAKGAVLPIDLASIPTAEGAMRRVVPLSSVHAKAAVGR
ncbi:MAG: metallophosphoesterase [Planctomycetota bacterium]